MTPLLLAAVAAVPTFADAPKPPPGTPVPGGAVVSPDAKLVFVPAKDGGVEALELATGKVAWTNPDAKKLAGASGRLVVAWVADEKKPNTFRVVVIESATGKTVVKSDAVEMPEWATTARTWGRTFRTAARAEADPVVVVWEARASYAGGARPTPEIEKAARKEATGVVTVDLQTGKVKVLDRKPAADEFKPGPGGAFNTKAGDYEFRATEAIPKFKPGAAMVTTVTLTVLKGKDELWSRELAGNPWSPPPP